MPVPDTGGPAAAGYAEASGSSVPRGDVPQPVRRPDLHPALPGAAAPGRHRQAQPAARRGPRAAPRRGRRLHRAGDDDALDRRVAAQGWRGRGPRADQRPADLPPLLLSGSTRRSTPSSSQPATRSTRFAPSSAPTALATCRSQVCCEPSTSRTTGSALPASTATTRSPSRMTRPSASSFSRGRVVPVAETRGMKGAAPRAAYLAAGVDVEAGERAVGLIRAAVASTRRPEVVGGLGGFAGFMEIPAGYRRPLLVASTDGVGTKVALGRRAGRLDGLGIDLVAMCADDVACAGAEPLFVLDYLAVGKADPRGGGGGRGRGRRRLPARWVRPPGWRDGRAPGCHAPGRPRPRGNVRRRR